MVGIGGTTEQTSGAMLALAFVNVQAASASKEAVRLKLSIPAGILTPVKVDTNIAFYVVYSTHHKSNLRLGKHHDTTSYKKSQ